MEGIRKKHAISYWRKQLSGISVLYSRIRIFNMFFPFHIRVKIFPILLVYESDTKHSRIHSIVTPRHCHCGCLYIPSTFGNCIFLHLWHIYPYLDGLRTSVQSLSCTHFLVSKYSRNSSHESNRNCHRYWEMGMDGRNGEGWGWGGRGVHRTCMEFHMT